MLKNFTTKEDGDLAEKITKKYMDYYDSLIKKGENFLINSSESESGSGE
jgi:hypothetical protein